MQVMMKPQPQLERGKLKRLRTELGYTQEDFAIYAQIRVKTYRQAEQRASTSYVTALAIQKGLNELRVARNMSALILEDLGLEIK